MRGSPRSGKRRSPSGPRPSWWKVDDAVWEQLEPLLLDPPRRLRNAGRKRYPARACLEGVLYLLYTGLLYVDLPRELGFPSGETCRRRLLDPLVQAAPTGLAAREAELAREIDVAQARVEQVEDALETSARRIAPAARIACAPGRIDQQRLQLPPKAVIDPPPRPPRAHLAAAASQTSVSLSCRPSRYRPVPALRAQLQTPR